MASAVGQEVSLQQPETAQNGKKTKNTKKKSANRPPPPPEAKLFEQLGHSMVDKLVRDMQVPHDSPTLLDRLRSLGLINVQSSVTNTPSSTNPSSQAGTIHGFKTPSLIKSVLTQLVVGLGILRPATLHPPPQLQRSMRRAKQTAIATSSLSETSQPSTQSARSQIAMDESRTWASSTVHIASL